MKTNNWFIIIVLAAFAMFNSCAKDIEEDPDGGNPGGGNPTGFQCKICDIKYDGLVNGSLLNQSTNQLASVNNKIITVEFELQNSYAPDSNYYMFFEVTGVPTLFFPAPNRVKGTKNGNSFSVVSETVDVGFDVALVNGTLTFSNDYSTVEGTLVFSADYAGSLNFTAQ